MKKYVSAAAAAVLAVTLLSGCGESNKGIILNANDSNSSIPGYILDAPSFSTEEADNTADEASQVSAFSDDIFGDFEQVKDWTDIGSCDIALDLKMDGSTAFHSVIKCSFDGSSAHISVPNFVMLSSGDNQGLSGLDFYIDSGSKIYLSADSFLDFQKAVYGDNAQDNIDDIKSVIGNAKYLSLDLTDDAFSSMLPISGDIDFTQFDYEQAGNALIDDLAPIIKDALKDNASAIFRSENGKHSLLFNKGNANVFANMLKSFINAPAFDKIIKSVLEVQNDMYPDASTTVSDADMKQVKEQAAQLVDELVKTIKMLDKCEISIISQVFDDVFGISLQGNVKGEIVYDAAPMLPDDRQTIIAETESAPVKVDTSFSLTFAFKNTKSVINLPSADETFDLTALMPQDFDYSDDIYVYAV